METIVISNNDALIAELLHKCGKLWTVLEVTGIPVLEDRHKKGVKCITSVMKRLCFPLLLHCNLLYLWYSTVRVGGLNYGTIIDLVLPFLPNILWWMIYTRRVSLKMLLIRMANVSVHVKQSYYHPYVVNISLFVVFIYPPVLTLMKVAQNYPVLAEEVLRNVQEIIFPSLVTVMYIKLCSLLLQNLRSYKNIFHKQLDISNSFSVVKLIKFYVEITKDIETFENLLSAPVFILILKIFFTVSLTIMDMLSIENWMSTLMLEALGYFVFIFGTLGVLSICAANIPLEIIRIKSVLLDKISAQSHQDGMLCGEKQILFVLKRDLCVLTACNIFPLDRGFLLKAVATVIAQAVIFHQLGSSLSVSQEFASFT
ncbi:uncharacterized protein NPIL_650131 [Nephila pilipes]|uniref:Uncharacterized protein n=1 Tax=Nephila pilipes TaxID=299642 RepID=A0A8X6P2I6_NEPPI|nr:uncharacterized protein NPIL_650131 [Nephila pilipes]